MAKLLYVCEDFVPPATNGSNLVYLACLETLARDHEVFAVMFGDHSKVPSQTEKALKSLCKAHLIVRGVQNSSALKLLESGAFATPHIFSMIGKFVTDWRRKHDDRLVGDRRASRRRAEFTGRPIARKPSSRALRSSPIHHSNNWICRSRNSIGRLVTVIGRRQNKSAQRQGQIVEQVRRLYNRKPLRDNLVQPQRLGLS